MQVLFTQSRDVESPASREFRGVWIATVANIDWPTRPGLTNAELRSEMITILDRCESNNFNAIVFQIRASGDAFYNSKYEPWSWYLTGEQGRAPKGNWDPLTFVIEEAHDRGLEVHCWFNPYRANHPAQKGRLSNRHLARTNPSVVKSFGDYMWMDPGEKEVQDHSFNVFMDVVERYDVDGIHIDDYFYPYPSYGKGADFPDDPSWNRYVDSGGRLNRGDWRRQNVDTFVERVYKGIKERKPWVKFGISPFGIARANTPEGVKATFDQYEVLYADAVKWIEQGWCDYFTPQLYWPIEGDQSFRLLLKYWQGHNPKGIHLWPGGIPSNLNRSSNAWETKEVTDQIQMTRDMGAGGNVHFSMKAFTLDYKGVNKALTDGVYNKKALVPATTWLDAQAPSTPECSLDGSNGLLTLSGASADARFYAIYADFGDGATLIKVTSAARTSISGLRLSKANGVWVSVIDRVSNESPLQRVS